MATIKNSVLSMWVMGAAIRFGYIRMSTQKEVVKHGPRYDGEGRHAVRRLAGDR